MTWQRVQPAEASRDGSRCASADEPSGDSSAAVFNLSLGGPPNGPRISRRRVAPRADAGSRRPPYAAMAGRTHPPASGAHRELTQKRQPPLARGAVAGRLHALVGPPDGMQIALLQTKLPCGQVFNLFNPSVITAFDLALLYSSSLVALRPSLPVRLHISTSGDYGNTVRAHSDEDTGRVTASVDDSGLR